MDKRIIWFALIVIMAVAAIFIFRNGCNKPVTPSTPGNVIIPDFTIDPIRIQEGDSIHFEDHTAGATSWKWDFSDGAGGTSTLQSGYTTYYSQGMFTIRLIINDSIMDSTFVEVRPKGGDDKGPSPLPPKITGPTKAYVGESVTFTDKTPGAEHTEWQNYATGEVIRNSKTYTTTFSRKGSFRIVAKNEKFTGQGGVTVIVTDRRSPISDPVINDSGKTQPPTPPSDTKTRKSDAELKKLFSYIVTGKEEFTVKYKPVKDAIQDETVPVIIKGTTNTQKKLYGFCQYLNMSNPTVLDVQSDWDAINGFKTITVTVKDNN